MKTLVICLMALLIIVPTSVIVYSSDNGCNTQAVCGGWTPCCNPINICAGIYSCNCSLGWPQLYGMCGTYTDDTMLICTQDGMIVPCTWSYPCVYDTDNGNCVQDVNNYGYEIASTRNCCRHLYSMKSCPGNNQGD